MFKSRPLHYFFKEKKEKKDFIESVENIAEILVTFLVENRHVRSVVITTRPLAHVTNVTLFLFYYNFMFIFNP